MGRTALTLDFICSSHHPIEAKSSLFLLCARNGREGDNPFESLVCVSYEKRACINLYCKLLRLRACYVSLLLTYVLIDLPKIMVRFEFDACFDRMRENAA